MNQGKDDRLFSWQFLAGIVVIVFLVLDAPQLSDLLHDLADPHDEPDAVADVPVVEPPPSFEVRLDSALRAGRKKATRKEAHALFTQLLADTTDPVERAELLPRAADFYLNGIELPSDEIEKLYQDALVAIEAVHSNDYYDYENVYRGLEKLYLSQNRFDEAVVQTRLILAFYDRYYKDEETRYLFKRPTTIRLANHLKSAGHIDEARVTYERALEMTRQRGHSTRDIEALIANLDLPEGAEPVQAGSRLVAPPGLPPYPKPRTDLKERIESISVDGLTVERIEENVFDFKIHGYAVDNPTLAAYMRRLREDVNKPTLQYAAPRDVGGQTMSAFSIVVSK